MTGHEPGTSLSGEGGKREQLGILHELRDNLETKDARPAA